MIRVPSLDRSCSLGLQETHSIERAPMKKIFAVFLCLLFPISAFAGDNSYKVVYDGGSLPNAKAGANMKLFIEGNNIRIMKDKTEVAVVPAASVTEISYGQDVH
jgi:hypothetical protein